MTRSFASLAAFALVITGCATLASGTTQTISVTSNVEGAEIFLDGNFIGKTPFTGPVDKNKKQLRVTMDGYRPQDLTLSKSLEPVFWGNIILGGTIGSLTDFATGAAYHYAPATYQVDMQAVDQADADFLHDVAVRKFAMVYLREIATDISNEGGEYLSALVEIVNMEATTPVTPDDVTSAFTEAAGDAFAFGSAMSKLR